MKALTVLTSQISQISRQISSRCWSIRRELNTVKYHDNP